MYRIGDFLIQIKNAYMANKKKLEYPHSNVAEAIGKILEKENYIVSSKVVAKEGSKSGRKIIVIELKYTDRMPAISDIKLISKSSVHHYTDKSKLNRMVAANGIGIISTSQGIMTAQAARKNGIGGEMICKIY